jgi:hypothetical protein
MALFRKNNGPAAKIGDLEAGLEKLQARRAALQTKLADAVASLEEAVSRSRRELLEQDLDQHHFPREEIGAKRDEIDTISGALADLDEQIVAAEQKLADERDKATRQEAGAELIGLTDALAAATDGFAAASEKVFAAIGPIAARVPHTSPAFGDTFRTLTRDLAMAAQEMISNARNHANAIVAAHAEIQRPAPPVPAPEPLPELERQPVLLLLRSKWVEHGVVKVSGSGCVIPLPIDVARAAIGHGHAIAMDDERLPALRAQYAPEHGVFAPEDCQDLCAAKPERRGAKYFDPRTMRELPYEPGGGSFGRQTHERVAGTASFARNTI